MRARSESNLLLTPDYQQFIADLKSRVASARLSAARAVNRDLILLYWDIGQAIAEKQESLGWGDSVVEMVSKDLQRGFPGNRGFSEANVWRMRQFYFAYTQADFLAQVVRETRRRRTPQGWAPFLEQLVPEPTDDEAHRKSILAQAVRELVAAIPWGHHVLLLGRIKAVPELLWGR